MRKIVLWSVHDIFCTPLSPNDCNIHHCFMLRIRIFDANVLILSLRVRREIKQSLLFASSLSLSLFFPLSLSLTVPVPVGASDFLMSSHIQPRRRDSVITQRGEGRAAVSLSAAPVRWLKPHRISGEPAAGVDPLHRLLARLPSMPARKGPGLANHFRSVILSFEILGLWGPCFLWCEIPSSHRLFRLH